MDTLRRHRWTEVVVVIGIIWACTWLSAQLFGPYLYGLIAGLVLAHPASKLIYRKGA